MNNLNTFDWMALILLIIGGINWGMVGLFNLDLVSTLFGDMTMFTRTIYTIVSASALYTIYILTTKTQL